MMSSCVCVHVYLFMCINVCMRTPPNVVCTALDRCRRDIVVRRRLVVCRHRDIAVRCRRRQVSRTNARFVVWVCSYVCMYECVCACVCVCVCVCVYVCAGVLVCV